MFKNIFLSLEKLFYHKDILIYGDITLSEYEILRNISSRVKIVSENISEMLKLKDKYKDIELENSLYFIDEKFDILLNFSNLPLSKDYLKKLGIYIEFYNIDSDEKYYNIILDQDEIKKRFSFNKNIEFYNKKVLVIVTDGKKEFLDYKKDSIPQFLLKCYSENIF